MPTTEEHPVYELLPKSDVAEVTDYDPARKSHSRKVIVAGREEVFVRRQTSSGWLTFRNLTVALLVAAGSLAVLWQATRGQDFSTATETLSGEEASVLQAMVVQDRPSLYCFSVMRRHGYELHLMRAQANRSAGIFGCNQYTVFSDAKVYLTRGPPLSIATTILPVSLNCGVGGVKTASWTNTRIFVTAWKWLSRNKDYMDHDWVVKVDPDAVFFPAVLRGHLRHGIKVTEVGMPLYFQNCDKNAPPGFGMYGALEVLSSAAATKFILGMPKCKEKYKTWMATGEDMFMQSCMDYLKIPFIQDYALLKDENCLKPPVPCNSGEVAFHPTKSVEAYLQCFEQAGGVGQPSLASSAMVPTQPLEVNKPTSTSSTITTSTTTSSTATTTTTTSSTVTTTTTSTSSSTFGTNTAPQLGAGVPGNAATGHVAVLSSDAGEVQAALRKAGLRWVGGMQVMLGRAYPYVETSQPGLIALKSYDGSNQGLWYFPRDVVSIPAAN